MLNLIAVFRGGIMKIEIMKKRNRNVYENLFRLSPMWYRNVKQ